MKFMDRLLTIVITATITSIIWILFGATWLDMAEEQQETGEVETAPTAPTPSAPPIMEPADPTPALAPTPAPAPTAAGPGEPAAEPQMPPVPSPTTTPNAGVN
ncbi:hypothetical protein [Erythrobacter sp. THAF29]|uniref:hypothetical protein n=1 Tax=Erythrobacter sp. THAF29 TaxID=2587851 RepID=UPI0012683FAC|nr:hypothetical protein [Erythrobacter sp. THAF29]QFT77722.1 hypothetical protein FIU90_09260 [Erythrobacter sp. THAF29]